MSAAIREKCRNSTLWLIACARSWPRWKSEGTDEGLGDLSRWQKQF
jgi:hypothetical protein